MTGAGLVGQRSGAGGWGQVSLVGPWEHWVPAGAS